METKHTLTEEQQEMAKYVSGVLAAHRRKKGITIGQLAGMLEGEHEFGGMARSSILRLITKYNGRNPNPYGTWGTKYMNKTRGKREEYLDRFRRYIEAHNLNSVALDDVLMQMRKFDPKFRNY